MKGRGVGSFLATTASLMATALAHGANEIGEITTESGLEVDFLIKAGAIAFGFLFALVLYLKTLQFGSQRKSIVFSIISFVVVAATAQLTLSTVAINIASESNGPIHWHADFEIWACGEKQHLKSPESLFDNKVGTGLFHHHDDDRIHIEGSLLKVETAGIEEFFEVIGGHLHEDELEFVSEHEGPVSYKNGDLCNDKESKVQAFLYRVVNADDGKGNWEYEHTKLDNFKEYIMAPHTSIPPGDCIIVEFGPEKEKTNKICESYTVAVEKGDLKEAHD